MKHILAAAALIVALAYLMFAQAPQAAAPAGPVILNLLPVMDDLDKAEEFFHRLLGSSRISETLVRAWRGTRRLLSSTTCTE